MTSPASLYATAAADITLDLIRGLIQSTPTESLTVEYKQEFKRDLPECVAAMANTYGGLILVGITDEHSGDRLVGVAGDVQVQIANACHDSLEPPWVPEMITVPISDAPDSRVILILRVDATRTPRPLLLRGFAPIRLPGRNARADRLHLGQLFAEASSPSRGAATGFISPVRGMPPPQQLRAWPEALPVDFIVRSGLVLPVTEDRSWLPLSERGVDGLADALWKSPVGSRIRGWAEGAQAPAVSPFVRQGFNRARHARLVAVAVSTSEEVPHPVEVVAEVHLPDRSGTPHSDLTFTVDFIVRTRLALAAAGWPEPLTWRLSVPELYVILDGFLAGLTDDAVVQALAELAGLDRVLVRQPAALYFATGPTVVDLLDLRGLSAIPDAGPSGGATLYADPSRDLRDPKERHGQVVAWLQQIALDAGLRGMERVVEALVATGSPGNQGPGSTASPRP
jgi:hypothetical protein